MKVYYDLHIHSALSPCADNSMRPRDIARMAKLNGLDIISIVDHVCGKNIAVSKRAADENGLLFLPGIEVTALAGTHLLCYFKTVKEAIAFSDVIYDSLPDEPVRARYFGDQLVLDNNDEVVEQSPKFFAEYTPFSTWEIVGMVAEYDGVVVPAHINREYQGMINTEGASKLKEYDFACVEVRKNLPIDERLIKKTKVIHNSDAHVLYNISEAENYLELKEKTVEAVFEYLST